MLPTPPVAHVPRRASAPLRVWRSRWPTIAALALAAGFADLARGGTTLAPLLLVLAYCVRVPAAVMGSGSQ